MFLVPSSCGEIGERVQVNNHLLNIHYSAGNVLWIQRCVIISS